MIITVRCNGKCSKTEDVFSKYISWDSVHSSCECGGNKLRVPQRISLGFLNEVEKEAKRNNQVIIEKGMKDELKKNQKNREDEYMSKLDTLVENVVEETRIRR